jgi:hypothetical protein
MTHRIDPVSVELLARPALLAMREAGDELIGCYRDLAARDAHLVGELLDGDNLEEERHYPADEVRDPASGAQYYFHAHLDAELGHFHAYVRDEASAHGDDDFVHLFGVSIDELGLPVRLFVTDLRATGGRWCRTDEAPALLARFTFDATPPRYRASRALPALARLFWPDLLALLAARGEGTGGGVVGESERVLVSVEVSIDVRRAAVEVALAEHELRDLGDGRAARESTCESSAKSTTPPR